MTEQTNATTSEQQPKPIGYVEGAPEAVQLEVLDAIVGFKDAQRDELGDSDEFEQLYSQKLEQVMAAKGIVDDPNDENKHAEYEFIKTVYQLTAETSPDDWKLVKLGDASKRIERSAMRQMVKEHYADDTSAFATITPEATSEEGGDDEVEAPKKQEVDQSEEARADRKQIIDEQTSELVGQYAELLAERTKKMTKRDAEAVTEIKQVRRELSETLSAVATELMDKLESEGVSAEDMPGIIDTFITEQTSKVIAGIEANRAAEYERSSVLTRKFLDWWSKGSEKKGLVTTNKIKKAAFFALPSMAVAALVAPAVGAVAGAGAAFLAGRSVARSVGGAKLDRKANARRNAELLRAETYATINKLEDEEMNHIEVLSVIDSTAEKQRKRNRNRVIGGVGIALSVGLLSGTVADWLGDKFDGVFNNNDQDRLRRLGDPKGNDRDGDGTVNRFDSDRDGDGVPNGNDPAPNNPNIPDGNGGQDTHSRDKLFDGRFGTRELTPEGRDALAEQLNDYKVKSGDSVWSLSEQFLHEQGVQNPTTYEVDATKDILLKELQASGNADSRGWLSAGDTIKIK